MYIRTSGFGDPQPARTATPLTQAPPRLTFFRIDSFYRGPVAYCQMLEKLGAAD